MFKTLLSYFKKPKFKSDQDFIKWYYQRKFKSAEIKIIEKYKDMFIIDHNNKIEVFSMEYRTRNIMAEFDGKFYPEYNSIDCAKDYIDFIN